MTAELALACALGAPVLQALLVALLARPPGLRDVVHIGFSIALLVAAGFLVHFAARGETARLALAQPLPNVDLAFNIEPLGALAAAVIAGLGVLHAAYTAGYVRAVQDKTPARLMANIALASAAAIGVALSANLFTFFVAYQALTLATFPLVAHAGGEEAQRAARTYLAILLTASVGLFLPAMVWTYAIAGALDFRPGGVLTGHVDPLTANALLVLFVLGLAKAAIPPNHGWLNTASQSSFPALISIYAITVLPVGGVGVLKITAYVFGAAMHQAAFAANGLLVLAGGGMCAAALIALSKQDLRERIGFSAMAQSLAAVTGALLALPQGAYAAALQIVALACATATLLMAAGTAYAVTGRRNAIDMTGLGRLMPWTFAAFALGSASMIGMPPFSGAWAKLWLITAAADAGLVWAAVLVGVAAVLTFAHLGPLAANALVGRAPTDPFKRPDGASILLVAPVILCAIATLWLLVLADPLASFLAPLWTGPQ